MSDTQPPHVTLRNLMDSPTAITLDSGDKMLLHVALCDFDATLAKDGLGDDEHGTSMVDLYRTRIRNLLLEIVGLDTGYVSKI